MEAPVLHFQSLQSKEIKIQELSIMKINSLESSIHFLNFITLLLNHRKAIQIACRFQFIWGEKELYLQKSPVSKIFAAQKVSRAHALQHQAAWAGGLRTWTCPPAGVSPTPHPQAVHTSPGTLQKGTSCSR